MTIASLTTRRVVPELPIHISCMRTAASDDGDLIKFDETITHYNSSQVEVVPMYGVGNVTVRYYNQNIGYETPRLNFGGLSKDDESGFVAEASKIGWVSWGDEANTYRTGYYQNADTGEIMNITRIDVGSDGYVTYHAQRHLFGTKASYSTVSAKVLICLNAIFPLYPEGIRGLGPIDVWATPMPGPSKDEYYLKE